MDVAKSKDVSICNFFIGSVQRCVLYKDVTVY